MSVTIGLVANVYQEVNALPGWLESAKSWADWVGVMHAGPGGEKSDDGTMEILRKWGVPTQFCAIDEGFGAVRTKTLRMCPCNYVVLLDADERVLPVHKVLTCTGESTPQSVADQILTAYTQCRPDWDAVGSLGSGLTVCAGNAYKQDRYLRDILEYERPDAVCTIRRHWHDFAFGRPTQDWFKEPDWQMRIVRNSPSIYFDPNTRMHEKLVGANKVFRADLEHGPFMDHFHFPFKKLEMVQRSHDIEIYNAIHEGREPPKRSHKNTTDF